MRKTIESITCDECGKESQRDKCETRFGGNVFSGVVSVKRIVGGTDLTSLAAKKDFEFCSIKCMKKHDFNPTKELKG